MQRAKKQGACVSQLEDAPPLPEWSSFIWDLFAALSNARLWVDGRPRAIPPSEVSAYCNLAQIQLDPIEFKLFRDLDWEFIDYYG